MPETHDLINLLRQGVNPWNEWRNENPTKPINLEEANLSGADLGGANFREANFSGANFSGANLSRADVGGANFSGANLSGTNFSGAGFLGTNFSNTNLIGINLSGANFNYIFPGGAIRGKDLSGADLRGATLSWIDVSSTNLTGANLTGANLHLADLSKANLTGANLSEADLSEADLRESNLRKTNLTGANLRGANLRGSSMIETNLTNANLSDCKIYGIATSRLILDGANQVNMLITDETEAPITVDNLEMAQFIDLLIYNPNLRDVIDTVSQKVVLILGRFTPERKVVLDVIREELRQRNYVPILFDFEKPSSRDLTETIVTLAHLSRFIVADLTDAKSIPQELSSIIPNLPSVAIFPLILSSQHEYAMFEHWNRYPWVLPIHEYETQEQLIAELGEKVIRPAEEKVYELRPNNKL